MHRPEKTVYPKKQLNVFVIGLHTNLSIETSNIPYMYRCLIDNGYSTNQCSIQCSCDYSRIHSVTWRLKLFK